MSEDQARKNICVSNANKLLNELVEAINEAFGEGVKRDAWRRGFLLIFLLMRRGRLGRSVVWLRR